MRYNRRRSNRVVFAALLLSFFAIPHLIDDFLFDIPEAFGMTDQLAQLLAGVFAVVLILSIAMGARESRGGYTACLSLGVFLALAGILKHVPLMMAPGPYWSGWFSEVLIYGLIGSGLALAGASTLALWRRER